MTTPSTRPLAGIKVLDLTRVLSGPYCGQMLFDLGAEVIKIENPSHGDDSRLFQPFKNGRSLYYAGVNSGKKSLTLNFKNPKAIEILIELIKTADVLIENYRPGVMKKFGVDYESARKINPRLIFVSISGFGQTGPDAEKPSYDILAQARGGVMSLTGIPGNDEPVLVGVSLSDILAGVFAGGAVSTALYQREKTGEGQHIDVSMLDCQVAILESAMMRYQATRISPKPVGCRHPTEAPFQSFHASDRPFVLAAIAGDTMFHRLCDCIGRPEMGKDPEFSTTAARQKNVAKLSELLQAVFITRPAAEWVALLEENRIPVSLIQNLDEVCRDPQILARHMLIDTEDTELEGIKLTGCPMKMSASQELLSRPPAAKLGEHNVEVLSTLGYSEEDVARLKEEEVI